VDGWKEGDGSDEVQVVRGYCLFVPIALIELEKGEKERGVCVCKIDRSIGTSNHTLMAWMSVIDAVSR
jgi:hypothetical protein